jgi:hypothetical protein
LDDEHVQAKLFEVVVKPVREASMAALGAGLGDKVAEMLNQIKIDFDDKLISWNIFGRICWG